MVSPKATPAAAAPVDSDDPVAVVLTLFAAGAATALTVRESTTRAAPDPATEAMRSTVESEIATDGASATPPLAPAFEVVVIE